MIERPDLSNEAITATLDVNWGIRVSDITFLPVGNETGTWVFRAGDYFLKMKRAQPPPAVVDVPRMLNDLGIRQVVAPVPMLSGAMFAPAADFWLILYPFIEGQSGMDAGLTDAQWVELGATLRQIHEARLPEEVQEQVAQETFVPKWAGMVRRLDALIAKGGFSDASQCALAEFWKQRRAEILGITARCEELGHMAAARSAPTMLCHADIHTANVLVDRAGGLHIVDWDQPIYAPVERDLIFLIEQIGMGLGAQPVEESLFLQGYGPVVIDRVTMAYYCYEWAVQEFGDYGERVFLLPDAGEATRAASVEAFMQLFNSGDVVESACDWEKALNATPNGTA